MTLEENKNVVARLYEALERNDYETVESLCHKDFTFYSQVDTPRPGVEGFIAAEKKHLDAFEGFRMTTETVAEGDRVAAFVIFEGRQSKEIFGIPPEGAKLRMSMCNLFKIRDGKIVEKRAHYDRLDHIEQLKAGAGK